MNNTAEMTFFWISQGKVATCKVDKSVTFHVKFLSGLNMPKIIKIG